MLSCFVGLALVVHGYLRAALVGRCNLLCSIGIVVIDIRATCFTIEFQVHRGFLALCIDDLFKFDGLSGYIVGFLLVIELDILPSLDRFYLTVLQPVLLVSFQLLFGCLLYLFGITLFSLLLSVAVHGLPDALPFGNELDTSLLDIHLQGGFELATVGELDFLVYEWCSRFQ